MNRPTTTEFRNEARRVGGVDRRLFMAYVAGLTAEPLLAKAARITGGGQLPEYPFTLGVASGDPLATSVLLWTRLAPRPLEAGGGMDPLPIAVKWEVAEDEQFKKVVSRGREMATPQLGHSVHAVAEGLRPDRWYYYRFTAGGAESPVGRTRTTPKKFASPDGFRFAFASCQHYESGHYAAYRHMAEQDLDMVVHLGDYIYEGKAKKGGVREHVGNEIESLDDYRRRHALYRSDALLQAMHAQCPWMVTWDDHEFDNNYAASVSEKLEVDPVDFLVRRANAYQAYYEAMPLRPRSLPKGPNLRLYRKVRIGDLAEMFVLDTRQYRCDQPQGDGKHAIDATCLAANQSMLGAEQLEWLEASLLTSSSRWNILAQQVMMGAVDRAGNDEGYSMDQWSGYLGERNRLMSFLAERRVANPVVLTGDIHSNWVNDLHANDLDEKSPIVATEFVGTSISSGGNGPKKTDLSKLQAKNPNVKFHDRQRGYVACELTHDNWTSRYYTVDDVTKSDSRVDELATFVVESGQPGAQRS
ncbi:alkaline phosphatase D family protein [Botrimarina mediterranea]|uniref:Alkaline phosphatase D n=1 Tax=Botrimarina mediterranea TaxID=2528022 RepID=A0A518K4E5_9BACT|nr:alkaline phosphatase D family protein [Botrimarina mediterranea]QDV72635.1 Alkaline phosphatase D precursor [Botrimarina mediterranea]QDV77207.1 Alkaline phosphatase D precursor [Planctomycetes bacterium K2D]